MQIKFEEEKKGGDHMINPENDGSSSSDEDFDKLVKKHMPKVKKMSRYSAEDV